MALTGPLKWHGGKQSLAKRIVDLMPPHLHYVEPYFGGGAVLLARNPGDSGLWCGKAAHERGVSEVVNDINGELSNFWRVLQDPESFANFRRRVEAIPFSETEWNDAVTCGTDPAQRAVAFFVRCRQSLAGRQDTFASISRNRTRRCMNEQASAWLSVIDGLPDVHTRLKRVVILNRPALEVIRQQDGPQTLFYLDPPYLPETRTAREVYQFEMPAEDHRKLLTMIRAVKGKVMLSGYQSDLYDRELDGWQRHEFDVPNNAAGGSSKRRMKECIWCNFWAGEASVETAAPAVQGPANAKTSLRP